MERREIQLGGGGTLRFWEDGALVVLEAQREDDRQGLYKVWLHGRRENLLLGTLAPEGGRLCLRRRVFRQELERKGCWPVTAGECVMAFPFAGRSGRWWREECPGRLVSRELKHCFGERAALYRPETDGFLLAFGFDPSRAFPVPPLFCLAKCERVEGRTCVVFHFDREGVPVLPHDRSDTGEDSDIS